MIDTLTTTIFRALRNFLTPAVNTPNAIERWAEIEFKKDSKFAISFYNMHGTFPSADQIR